MISFQIFAQYASYASIGTLGFLHCVREPTRALNSVTEFRVYSCLPVRSVKQTTFIVKRSLKVRFVNEFHNFRTSDSILDWIFSWFSF